jgi:hypothetical protein
MTGPAIYPQRVSNTNTKSEDPGPVNLTKIEDDRPDIKDAMERTMQVSGDS